MIVGCVREIKESENRVGLMPTHAFEYVNAGHTVIVESGLGEASGFPDALYSDAGATVVDSAEAVWAQVDMMIKVKEPLESEYPLMRAGQILFTYLHLADNAPLTQALVDRKVTAFAYETVTDSQGRLPLLRPMSEVAGRLSIQQGAKYLEGHYGGKGILLSGVPGVHGGHVVIIGAGVVGMSACKTALGTGASVSILDTNLDRLAYIEDVFNGRVNTIFSDEHNIQEELKRADIVIGSVLIPGDKAPKLVRREHLELMEKGTVLVDVAIDQGGCFETSKPTTHQNPIFIDSGIVHYCVTNMPGAVPQTSTHALGNATIRYGLEIANRGALEAIQSNEGLFNGLNAYDGYITNAAVARSQNFEYNNMKNTLKG